MIAALIEAELRPTNPAAAQASDMLPGIENLPKIELEAWRNYGRGIVLSKWNFPRASFNDATMAKIRFDNAVLTHATFDRANLILADFSHANAEGASFRAVEAPSAVMQHATLTKADFSDANLSCADLTGSDLTGADLRGSDLSHANKNLLPCANKELPPEGRQQSDETAEGTNPSTTSSSVGGGGGQQETREQLRREQWANCNGNRPKSSNIVRISILRNCSRPIWRALTCKARPGVADFRGAYFDETTVVDSDTDLGYADLCGAHLGWIKQGIVER